jgi:hypothetical protein
MDKNGPDSPDFEDFFFFKLQDLYDKFQQVAATNRDGFWFFPTFISSM